MTGFSRSELLQMSGLTFSELFKIVIWESAEVQHALSSMSPHYSCKLQEHTDILILSKSYFINFRFDAETMTRNITKGRIIKGKTKPLYINPTASRKERKKIPNVKVEEDRVIPDWPENDAFVVRTIWRKLAALFQLISHGEIIVTARSQSGDLVQFRKSDWSSDPDTLWFNWKENTLKRRRHKKWVQVFESLEFNLSDQKRTALDQNGPVSGGNTKDWLLDSFFDHPRFCSKDTVWQLTKDRFPNLSHSQFKAIWNETAPRQWKLAGRISKKEIDINRINQIRLAI